MKRCDFLYRNMFNDMAHVMTQFLSLQITKNEHMSPTLSVEVGRNVGTS
jgi:hypothetical protein